jgi:hypothetical protein
VRHGNINILRIVTVEEVTQKEAGPAGDHHHALI